MKIKPEFFKLSLSSFYKVYTKNKKTMSIEETSSRLIEISDSLRNAEEMIFRFMGEYEENDLLLIPEGPMPMDIAGKDDGGEDLLYEVWERVEMAIALLMDMTESYSKPGAAWLRKEKIGRLLKGWEDEATSSPASA